MPLFIFLFDIFLEARAEILEKKFVCILVQTMAPKRRIEINSPLGIPIPNIDVLDTIVARHSLKG